METGKILVMTSNSRGGIAQFAFFLAKELNASARVEDVVLMVPRDSEYSVSGQVHIEFYDKVDALKPKKEYYQKIISKIDKHEPTHVIFSEFSTCNMQLASSLYDRYHLSSVVHDALSRPGFSLKNFVRERVFTKLLNKNVHRFEKIIVLSEAVLKELNKRYTIPEDRVVRMKLCSHLHVTDDVQQGNMIGEDYFLFFGRIQKYKGLETLFEAYAKDRNKILPKLVVAGKGEFTKREKELFEQIKNQVILMKKYITDETLASLMSYSKATVLPYKAATQSGVIPMAYQFGIPVVVSDEPGLTENVVDEGTGYVFPVGNSTELYTILKRLMIGSDDISRMKPIIKKYYEENYNWKEHVDYLIDHL